MIAHEYLEQLKYLEIRVDSKIKEVAMLNDLSTKCTSVMSDMPKVTSITNSKIENTIIKITLLQEEIQEDIDTLIELKSKIIKLIKVIDNIDYKTLLEKRYLCYQSLEKIAVDMGYSIQHVYRIKDNALKEFEKILKDDRK